MAPRKSTNNEEANTEGGQLARPTNTKSALDKRKKDGLGESANIDIDVNEAVPESLESDSLGMVEGAIELADMEANAAISAYVDRTKVNVKKFMSLRKQLQLELHSKMTGGK